MGSEMCIRDRSYLLEDSDISFYIPSSSPFLPCNINACQAVIHRLSSEMPQLAELVARAVEARLGQSESGAPSSSCTSVIPPLMAPEDMKAQASPPTKDQSAQAKTSVFTRLSPATGASQTTGEAVPNSAGVAGGSASASKAARVKPGFVPYRPGSALKHASGDHPPNQLSEGSKHEGQGGGGAYKHPYDQGHGPGRSFLDR